MRHPNPITHITICISMVLCMVTFPAMIIIMQLTILDHVHHHHIKQFIITICLGEVGRWTILCRIVNICNAETYPILHLFPLICLRMLMKLNHQLTIGCKGSHIQFAVLGRTDQVSQLFLGCTGINLLVEVPSASGKICIPICHGKFV